MANENKKTEKKRKNPFVRFVKFIVSFILACAALLLLWGGFSAVHRAPALQMLPKGFETYVRMDSAWKALNPLLDLRAAEVLFSSPNFASFRAPFMQLRSSPLRKNKAAAVLASRRADIALYAAEGGGQDFLALIDLSFLSALTSPVRFYAPLLKVENIDYIKEDSCFEYGSGAQKIFIRPYRNLVVASSSKDLLKSSLTGKNAASYSIEEKKLLTQKSAEPVKVTVDARSLLASFTNGDETLAQFSSYFSKDTLSVLSFGITDSKINVKADIPVNIEDENSHLSVVLKKSSGVPAILTKMSGAVNYYSIINAGTLEELKNLVFSLLPKDAGAETLWAKGNAASKTLFSLPLEDLLFSWMGKEFAVMGIEGHSDPVFAVQIQDERQRQFVFEKLVASIVLKDDTSLILDGVRIPRLEIPQFLQNVLSLMGASLPSPYYVVNGSYIYFSQSAEALSIAYTAEKSGKRIVKNTGWSAVSEGLNPQCALSLFYDLEHSVPFFLRGSSDTAKILKLYGLGRADIGIKDSVLTLRLSAVAGHSGDMRAIPGFPIELEGKTDGMLYAESGKKAETVFWTENGRSVKALDLSSMNIRSADLPDECFIVDADKVSKGGGVLWAVTADGAVDLYNRSLESVKNFPVLTGEQPSASPAASENAVVFPTKSGKLCFVRTDASIMTADIPEGAVIKAAPAVLENRAAVYAKGFEGSVYIFEDGVLKGDALNVSGIGFGSPALLKEGNMLYAAFLTQAGNLYIWKDGELLEGFPKKLDGVFYSNVRAGKKSFFAVSSQGELFRIETDGTSLAVKIPHVSAKTGFVTVNSRDKDERVYVSSDGNVLYGFTAGLEILPSFPVPGNGRPVFADVNSDGKADCLTLSIDGKLNAWNVE
ncbi:MAG: hypothetical protein ACTTKL_05095 [Treponema sp.]